MGKEVVRLNKQAAFTLIELIVVITILSVMAVYAFSKFSDKSGYAEYTYQARLISTLRNAQARAMQDTRSGVCFQVNFSTSPSAFGTPSRSYEIPSNVSPTCRLTIDYTGPDYIGTLSADEMTDDNVSLQADSGGTAYRYIRFDSLGRPFKTGGPACSPRCELSVTGETSLKVCVESEGYIHAC